MHHRSSDGRRLVFGTTKEGVLGRGRGAPLGQAAIRLNCRKARHACPRSSQRNNSRRSGYVWHIEVNRRKGEECVPPAARRFMILCQRRSNISRTRKASFA